MVSGRMLCKNSAGIVAGSKSCAWVAQKPFDVASESPKSSIGGPKSSQECSKRVSWAAKSSQERPTASQERPKSVPRASQERPRASQERLRASKERPRARQETEVGAQSCPRRAKRRPRGSKLGSKDVQERSKSYKIAVQAQFDSKQRHPAKTMKNTVRYCKNRGSEGQRSMEK